LLAAVPWRYVSALPGSEYTREYMSILRVFSTPYRAG